MIKTIIKRDGRKVDFDLEKIAQAIFSAAQAMGGDNYDQARTLAEKVEALLNPPVWKLLLWSRCRTP